MPPRQSGSRVSLSMAVSTLCPSFVPSERLLVRFQIAIIVFVYLLDLTCTLLLYGYTNHWTAAAWSPHAVRADLSGSWDNSTLDCTIVWVFRVVTFPILAIVALKVGKPTLVQEAPPRAVAETIREYVSLVAPLLEHAPESKYDNPKAVGSPILPRINHRIKKNIVLSTMFFLNTGVQVYLGIKCIRFHFSNTNIQGPLMAAGILFVNIQSGLLRGLVERFTAENGHLVPALHSHPLHYLKASLHRCDLCRNSIYDKAYRCVMCDFDVCSNCFRKNDHSRAEGLLRGDKGVKREQILSSGQYFKRALSLVRPEWPIFSVAFVCLAVNSTASLALPNFQGRILQHVIDFVNTRSKSASKAFETTVLTYILISVATGFFGAVRGLCFNLVGRRIARSIKDRLFSSIIRQDIAFFDGTHSGDLTSRIGQDTSMMVAPCQTMLSSLISNIVLLIGGVVMCFWKSWRLSLLAFTTVLPVLHLTNVYTSWSSTLNREIYASLGQANKVATDALGNIRTVRALSAEEIEIKNFGVFTAEALRKGVKDAFGGAGTYAISNYLDLGAGVLLLWYGGYLCMQDPPEMSVGDLITFQLYFNMINSSYSALIDIIGSFTRAAGAAQRVFSLLDSLPDINPDTGVTPESITGTIELRDVCFTYQMRPDHIVLNHINLTIPSGKVFALVGRSGGGKSTIIHLLLRFYDPQEGSILLDGRNLQELRLKWLHENIGLVAQDTQLFSSTIEENITYGLNRPYSQLELEAAAKLACAHSFISEFPDGYRTMIGERGARLSGGQKQRIAIARVFLRKPKILLLDEATSALDTESEAQVQQAIDNLIKLGGSTVVLIAHRLSTVVNAHCIAVVDKGKIAEMGSHAELVSQRGIYHKLVSRQMEREKNNLDSPLPSKNPLDVIDSLLDQ